MENLVKRLNDILKCDISNRNRNVIASICLMEFEKLIKLAKYSEDFLLLKRYLDTLRYHIQSPMPMKLDFNKVWCLWDLKEFKSCNNKYLLHEDLDRILLEQNNQGVLLEKQKL